MDPAAEPTVEPGKPHRPWVRWVVDYVGLVSWAVAYFATGKNLLTATWVLVAASGAALAFGFIMERRIAPIPLVAAVAAIIFGGLTLVFKDPSFIKLKPTVMNLGFGLILLGGLALGRNPLKILFGSALQLSADGWRKLTLRYGLFFPCIAVLNEVIWRTQPEDLWVLFRFPGLMILTVIFSLTQAPFLMKYIKSEELPPPPVE